MSLIQRGGGKDGRREKRKETLVKNIPASPVSFKKKLCYFSEFVSDLILKVLRFWMIFKVLAQPLKSSHNENHMKSIMSEE